MKRFKGNRKPDKNDMKRDFKRNRLYLGSAFFYRCGDLSLYCRGEVWRYERGYFIRGMNI